jgi:endonuclease YncB( thermonuclease family)
MDNVYIDPNPELYAKFQQAKEMEKEQHENTWDDSFLFKDDWEMTFEQYYELTYGGDK